MNTSKHPNMVELLNYNRTEAKKPQAVELRKTYAELIEASNLLGVWFVEKMQSLYNVSVWSAQLGMAGDSRVMIQGKNFPLNVIYNENDSNYVSITANCDDKSILNKTYHMMAGVNEEGYVLVQNMISANAIYNDYCEWYYVHGMDAMNNSPAANPHHIKQYTPEQYLTSIGRGLSDVTLPELLKLSAVNLVSELDSLGVIGHTHNLTDTISMVGVGTLRIDINSKRCITISGAQSPLDVLLATINNPNMDYSHMVDIGRSITNLLNDVINKQGK